MKLPDRKTSCDIKKTGLGGSKLHGLARRTSGPVRPVLFNKILGPARGPPGPCRGLSASIHMSDAITNCLVTTYRH